MKTVVYPARISRKKDGVWYVQFLDIESGFTHGKTLDTALVMAGDVLSALLASRIDHGEPVPKPSARRGKGIYLIAPDAKVQAALLLRTARRARTQGSVAKAMGTSQQAYRKLEQPRANTTIGTLQQAAKALGKKFVIEFR
jgi:antitoxin HicB